jgi:hypothetical protein
VRKACFQHQFTDDLTSQIALSISADSSEPLTLLRKEVNQDGWWLLKDCAVENMNSFVNLQKIMPGFKTASRASICMELENDIPYIF